MSTQKAAREPDTGATIPLAVTGLPAGVAAETGVLEGVSTASGLEVGLIEGTFNGLAVGVVAGVVVGSAAGVVLWAASGVTRGVATGVAAEVLT